jgi:phenol 2-monooxygenase
MVLPREGGHLVRMYVELDNARRARARRRPRHGPEDIIAKAQRILRPFSST